jgi:TonB family protein
MMPVISTDRTLARAMDRARAATVLGLLLLALSFGACVDKSSKEKLTQAFQTAGTKMDEPPKMVNKELPFHYPAGLFARKVQGNVTLRLFVDQNGRVHAESTQVVESSGYASFDSAAIRGSQELQFVPAKAHGEPTPVTILFPVYFRYPGAAPLPGDTVLKKSPGSKQ